MSSILNGDEGVNKTLEHIFLLLLILIAFSIFYEVVGNSMSNLGRVKKVRYIVEKLGELKEKMISSGEITLDSDNFTVDERMVDGRDEVILKKITLEYHDEEIERRIEFLIVENSN